MTEYRAGGPVFVMAMLYDTIHPLRSLVELNRDGAVFGGGAALSQGDR